MTWTPLQRAVRLPLREEVSKLAESNPAAAAFAERGSEMWKNDRYTVIVYRHADGWVQCLSIRRNDRGAVRDWRHMQKIKSEIAGAETEGFQIFPAESRLVDSANQTWLFCLPPGIRLPLGFTERTVSGPEGTIENTRQRPFEEGILTGGIPVEGGHHD